MPRNRRPIKVYTFIDTNIFLDFYRSQNETSLNLLKKLESVKDSVICTYQVEMEFLKNRQRAIVDNISYKSIDIDSRLPAVLDDSHLSGSLKKHKKDLDKRKKDLKSRVAKIITNPASCDSVYSSLEAIFSSDKEHVLTRDMPIRHQIKRLARRRFILGYPPRKATDTSIGDAINWEWFIHCAKANPGKYIIVSRDSDYGMAFENKYYLNDALKSEFKDRVGKKSIDYTTKLSDALKAMEVSVTSTEEAAESEEIDRLSTASARRLSVEVGGRSVTEDDYDKIREVLRRMGS